MWSALMLYSSLSAPRPRQGATGSKFFAPQRFKKFRIHSGEIADEAEATCHFIVHHGFGGEARGVRRGNSDGRLTLGGDGRGQTLVQKPAKTITATSRVSRSVTRRSADKFALNSHALQRGGEEPAATVHDKDFVAFVARVLLSVRTKSRTVALSSSKAPANLMTVLIGVRFAPLFPACDSNSERPGRPRLFRDCRGKKR